MILKCPHCRNGVEVSSLKRQDGTGGGRECHSCKGMVRFSQPHTFFRRTIALVISALLTLIIGIRNPLTILLVAILLWVPMSIPVNMYSVYLMPLSLKPWKPRGKKPFDADDLDLFDHQGK